VATFLGELGLFKGADRGSGKSQKTKLFLGKKNVEKKPRPLAEEKDERRTRRLDSCKHAKNIHIILFFANT